MATTTPTVTIDRAWILEQFSKGVDSLDGMKTEAEARAQSPPDAELALLYSEIAKSVARHREVVSTIAARYGDTPSRGAGGGIGEAIGRIKDKVGEMGASSLDLVGKDLGAKSNAIHWSRAWVEAFAAIGDTQSSEELATVLAEEETHRDALQKVLATLVTRGARGELTAKKA
ncbi:hypothetical protein EP7_002109 [Isosphaeraceae bacterium EP7]